jgi:signal transduction histidine kinase
VDAAVLRGAGRSLVRGSTYLRWVYLLLGAALVLAFILIDSALVATVQEIGLPQPLEIALAMAVIALPPLALGLLPAVREVEGVAVESLLGVRFAERPLGPARNWSQRRRSAAWFLIHLLTGGIVGVTTTIGIPLGVILVAAPFRTPGDHELVPGIPYHVSGGWSDIWLPVVGVLCCVLPLVLAFVVGALLVRWAPAVLGPTATERIELLERRTTALVERNRLARELHDTVGHALSLVTLQAGAARKVLDTDPEFARTALAAMEESARSALTDLDHVLGLLRDDRASTLPQLTLGDVPRLVEATRAGGITVEVDATDGLDTVPAVVSREAYRIVQEGLTNAVRHAGLEPAELTVGLLIRTEPGSLRLELTNPVGSARRTRSGGGGRGLAGIRERVAVLRGSVDAGTSDGTWRLAVALPTGLDPKQRKDQP